VFRLGDGKSLMLIREDYTDVIDFLSMLCLHAIEARKLRQRIASPQSFRLIQDFVLKKAELVRAQAKREHEQREQRQQRMEDYHRHQTKHQRHRSHAPSPSSTHSPQPQLQPQQTSPRQQHSAPLLSPRDRKKEQKQEPHDDNKVKHGDDEEQRSATVPGNKTKDEEELGQGFSPSLYGFPDKKETAQEQDAILAQVTPTTLVCRHC
jgi:hypothetical protein